MPQPDYSYAVEPQFKTTGEAIEFKVNELYSSEQAKFAISKSHSYDRETMEQINERFWVKVTLLNSSVIDINNLPELQTTGAEIAKLVMSELTNAEEYNKVGSCFLKKLARGK